MSLRVPEAPAQAPDLIILEQIIELTIVEMAVRRQAELLRQEIQEALAQVEGG